MISVKRALMSCYDKTGLDVFAKELAALGVELIASGGTAEFLITHGLHVKTVETFAGMTEQLDGRVKTLHPKIHAGILARRDDPAHMKSVGEEGLIDLVVVNLYPFEQTVQQRDILLEEAVAQIDIGGVALLRAAAKNFSHVAVVCQSRQYASFIEALRRGKGALPIDVTQRLSVEAFATTSAYDTWISGYLAWRFASQTSGDSRTLPEAMTVTIRKRQALRYGENPHQQGAWYVEEPGTVWGLGTLTQLQGKDLSYNNLLDIDAAFRCLLDFKELTCAIVKHHSLCGLASGEAPKEAYERAYACDAESAFGGIVGFNCPIDASVAEPLSSTFLEVILASSVDSQAAARLSNKSNLRVVTLQWPTHVPAAWEWRQLLGSWVLQDLDVATLSADTLRVATRRQPTAQERADLMFAWNAAKHVKSNGIVIASHRATVGIGQGQPSRVGSVRLAIEKSGERSRNAVAASDGFFPFPDGVEWLAKAGVSAVIQPGGSIRDADVIAAADAANMTMLITGLRHFRH